MKEEKENYREQSACQCVSIKVMFQTSAHGNGEGFLYFLIRYRHTCRMLKSSYQLYACEWNEPSEQILLPLEEKRREYLQGVEEQLAYDLRKLEEITRMYEQQTFPFTADDVAETFCQSVARNSFFRFTEHLITQAKVLGKLRMSEIYATTLNSFRLFRQGKDLPIDSIDSEIINAYEAYLHRKGISLNSSSFYMRNLRAIYNRAVEKMLTQQRYPFRHVYTGIDKTIKRALLLHSVRQIKMMELDKQSAFARDMFLFSFYTRGMSFVDMAFLQKKDLRKGVLSYRRKKTGQRLFIKWEKAMQEIVERYATKESPYLLPIIRNSAEERKQYQTASHLINRQLKKIGEQLNLSLPLTMYVARHSWASIAKSKHIPISVISDGMGHDSETTTLIYLASLDTKAIDRANSIILRAL